ncbi:MAG: hypothetical protein DI617_02150 [Streptococcus pyogenes]|nr:MAG: hypothetical protein DI617_02150 [Streptococcus pyogenes]
MVKKEQTSHYQGLCLPPLISLAEILNSLKQADYLTCPSDLAIFFCYLTSQTRVKRAELHVVADISCCLTFLASMMSQNKAGTHVHSLLLHLVISAK